MQIWVRLSFETDTEYIFRIGFTNASLADVEQIILIREIAVGASGYFLIICANAPTLIKTITQ